MSPALDLDRRSLTEQLSRAEHRLAQASAMVMGVNDVNAEMDIMDWTVLQAVGEVIMWQRLLDDNGGGSSKPSEDASTVIMVGQCGTISKVGDAMSSS